jgi:hypothetical protein
MDERVQVRGLGDAVPGIQPTIQRAGQYSIGQVRAGRNKLMDLADALGQVNPVLQQYTQVADIQAQQFEDELAGKSPEEVQAMLKQTEGELDKQVRRGVMDWLTSPLNQKRKLKAVGKLASRDLVNEVRRRLINPNQGDPEDLNDRANFVRQEFIDNTPALQTSSFAQEGLNETTRNAIQGLVGDYEAQKAFRDKSETLFATGSSMYDKIYNTTQAQEVQEALMRGDFNFEVDRDVNGDVITLADSLISDWSDTGSYTAAEQRGLLKSVIQRLASDDMEDQAEGLLSWAKDNLKFGTAKMSTREYNELLGDIDKSSELAERQAERNRIELSRDIFAEFRKAYDDIDIYGKTDVNYAGEPISNVNELVEKAMRDPRLAQDITATTDLADQIKKWTAGNLNPRERKRDELIQETEGLNELGQLFTRQKLPGFIQQNYLQLQNDPQILDAQLNSSIELSESIQRKSFELAQSDLTEKEQRTQLLTFAQEEDKRIFDSFKKEVKERSVQKDKEDLDKNRVDSYITNEGSKLKAPEKGMFDKALEGLFGYDTEKGDLEETNIALKVLGAKEAASEEKEKSFEFLRSYGIRTSDILKNKLRPNAWKVEPTKEMITMAGNIPMTIPAKPGIRYSAIELDNFRINWMNINGFLDTFTDIEVLETGRSKDGTVIFDSTEFARRTRMTRLLPISILEKAKNIKNNKSMPEEVKRTAKAIGITDLVQFVKDQQEFAERLRLIK